MTDKSNSHTQKVKILFFKRSDKSNENNFAKSFCDERVSNGFKSTLLLDSIILVLFFACLYGYGIIIHC